MIRWCSNCQTYQGEVPPFDSYAITHGICEVCAAKGLMLGGPALAKIQPIVDFHNRVREEAKAGFITPPHSLLAEAITLEIQPIDLLIGLLQPALYEIGELWARGEVSIATEHRFSATVEDLTTLVLEHVRHGRETKRAGVRISSSSTPTATTTPWGRGSSNCCLTAATARPS